MNTLFLEKEEIVVSLNHILVSKIVKNVVIAAI